MLFVVQYNPVVQQMYMDAYNDPLSDADTEDYSELPELVDE